MIGALRADRHTGKFPAQVVAALPVLILSPALPSILSGREGGPEVGVDDVAPSTPLS